MAPHARCGVDNHAATGVEFGVSWSLGAAMSLRGVSTEEEREVEYKRYVLRFAGGMCLSCSVWRTSSFLIRRSCKQLLRTCLDGAYAPPRLIYEGFLQGTGWFASNQRSALRMMQHPDDIERYMAEYPEVRCLHVCQIARCCLACTQVHLTRAELDGCHIADCRMGFLPKGTSPAAALH